MSLPPYLPFLLALPLLLAGCRASSDADVEAGVSWELAEQRAEALTGLRYALNLNIPDSLHEPILGQVTVRFRLGRSRRPLVLDFNQPAERVQAVRVGETDAPYDVVNGHIVIDPAALQAGENAVTIDFLAGDGSLNRNADYLYTLFVPDRASVAFPCFDQPNLKARYRLTLHTPPAWTAVANGALDTRDSTATGVTYRFAETKPLSTYLFAFAAGRFQTETAVRDGRALTMYHRETDAEKVARNREAVFDLHATALRWLEEYTGIAYPFDKFDFVLIPSFQYGGMEHPGSILYRSNSLLLDASATQNQLLGRASLIAHETAHMWFGDLVTMNWFDDVWTKEVFANFMAAKIVNPSFPDINHDLRFLLAHYPAAYSIDRTEGANAIRQPLENMQQAGTLYGPIIYQKAPVVMKHLERLVGEETFRNGLRTYLDTFAFGNATWPALIEILDERSEADLTAWSRVWVEEPGRPAIRTDLSLDDAGRIASLDFVQSDPYGHGRQWIQRLDVLLAYPDSLVRMPVQLATAGVSLSAAGGYPAPNFILPNGDGVGYGYFDLDDQSRTYLLEHLPELPDAQLRGTVWVTLWEAMLEGAVAPDTLLALAVEALPVEADVLNIQNIAGYITEVYWRFIAAPARANRAPGLELLFWDLMQRAPSASLKATYFNAYRSVVLTERGVERLRAVWEQTSDIQGLTFSEENYTDMAQALAVRGVPDAALILEKQQARISNPDRQARFAFVRPSLSADPEIRAAFFESLKDPANRTHEPWALEGLRNLHHPLRAETSVPYIRPSLDLLEEIQRTGDIFFPQRWLGATLSGHQSAEAASIVRRFLDEHPAYPPRLRGKILQAADDLFRAVRMRSPGRSS